MSLPTLVCLRNETFSPIVSATPLRHQVSQRRHSHVFARASFSYLILVYARNKTCVFPCFCDALATPLRTHCRNTVATGHTVLASQGRPRNMGRRRLAAEVHNLVDMPKSTPIIFPGLGRGGLARSHFGSRWFKA